MGSDSKIRILIESLEHRWGRARVWWRPNRLGYTQNLDEAGRYEIEEAEKILEHCEPGNEVGWIEVAVLEGVAGPIERDAESGERVVRFESAG